MSKIQGFTLALFLCLAAPSFLSAAPTPIPVSNLTLKQPVSYSRDVADILSAKCVGCHSEAIAESKLNMEEVAGMLKGGKHGPAVLPGKAEASLLFQMGSHRVEPVMPPKEKKEAKPLTSDELGILKLWIDSGAKDDSAEMAQAETFELGDLPPGVQPIYALDITADGQRVACGRANLVQVYDADSGVEIITLGGHKDLIESVRFTPDGRRLAAGSYQFVTLWNVPTGNLTATFNGHGDQVKTAFVLPDGATIISSGLDKTVRFWDRTGKPIRQFSTPSEILALAASPDGKSLALGGPDNLVRIVSAADGKEISPPLSGHAGAILDLAFLAGGKKIASVSADGNARIWTLAEPRADKPLDPLLLPGSKGPIRALVVTPDGRIVITAGDDGKVRFWHAEDGKVSQELSIHDQPVLALAISPKGDRLLTGSADKTAKVLELPGGRVLKTLSGHLGPVNTVAFSPDGTRFATGGNEGGVKIWNTSRMEGLIAFGHKAPGDGPLQPIQRLAFAGNETIISASADKTLKAWSFEGDWSEMKPLGPHAFRVLALDFNPDGTLLAAGGGEPSRSGEVKIWEVGRGLPVRTLDGLHSDTIFSLRFSPDGSRLATAGADKFAKVSRVSDGKELRSYEGHTHHVLAVDWKSDGTQIVTGGGDNVIKLWEVETGEQLRTFQPAGKQVTSVRWLAGKPEVFGASGDKQVRLWNSDNGGVARAFSGPGDYIFAVASSKDGSRVVAGCADSVLFIWNGQNAQLQRKIDAPIPRTK